MAELAHQFLAAQRRAALDRIWDSGSVIAGKAAHTLDPRRHPLPAVAIATAVGFATTAFAGSGRSKRRKIETETTVQTKTEAAPSWGFLSLVSALVQLYDWLPKPRPVEAPATPPSPMDVAL
jgi:hypothetical protein